MRPREPNFRSPRICNKYLYPIECILYLRMLYTKQIFVGFSRLMKKPFNFFPETFRFYYGRDIEHIFSKAENTQYCFIYVQVGKQIKNYKYAI